MSDETFERTETASVLRFRRDLLHPPRKVWRALTEDRHLAGWFPTTVEGERVAGAPLRFSFRQSEGPPFDGEMTCFDPPAVLELRWGDDLLRFDLEPVRGGEGCVLTLTVTFPEHGRRHATARGGTCASNSWPTCATGPNHRGIRPSVGGTSTLATSNCWGRKRRRSAHPRGRSGCTTMSTAPA